MRTADRSVRWALDQAGDNRQDVARVHKHVILHPEVVSLSFFHGLQKVLKSTSMRAASKMAPTQVPWSDFRVLCTIRGTYCRARDRVWPLGNECDE